MGFWDKILGVFDLISFGGWLESASDEELKAGYEESRLKWLKSGGGPKTSKMELINKEISRRATEKWKNDPRRNPDPNFRWTDANRWDKD